MIGDSRALSEIASSETGDLARSSEIESSETVISALRLEAAVVHAVVARGWGEVGKARVRVRVQVRVRVKVSVRVRVRVRSSY